MHSVLKKIGLALGVVIVIVAGVTYNYYRTLSPCDVWVKKEVADYMSKGELGERYKSVGRKRDPITYERTFRDWYDVDRKPIHECFYEAVRAHG